MGKREQTSELDLRPGMTLGRNYFAVEFLGSGWEGEVWKVEERATGIPRAAKIFYDRPGLRKGQIRRYAQKIYRLRSCPIVTQYHHRDVARVGGGPVEILVSDFVQGEVLSRYVQRQPGRRLPVYEALHLLHSLALGIEQIHVHGEYHADVHTGNILMKRRGLAFELHLIADGLSAKEIAVELEISTKTVEAHRTSLMRKLGVRKATELVRYALRHGLIEP